MKIFNKKDSPKEEGFSLVEVVLAIGIFSLTIATLIGLFSSTMTSVKDISDIDQALMATSRVDHFVDSVSFDHIFELVQRGAEGENFALYFYQRQKNINQPPFPVGPYQIDDWGDYDIEKPISKSEVEKDIEAGFVVGGTIIVLEIPKSTQDNPPFRNIQEDSSENYPHGSLPFWAKIHTVNLNDPLEISEKNLLLTYPIAKVR